jgi:hypothetical protein
MGQGKSPGTPGDKGAGKPARGRNGDVDQATRQDQRAQALRANLMRRKQQVGARRGGKGVGKSEASALDGSSGESQD